MSGVGRKPEGVAVALPYLVTFRSRMLMQRSQDGATSDSVRSLCSHSRFIPTEHCFWCDELRMLAFVANRTEHRATKRLCHTYGANKYFLQVHEECASVATFDCG